MNDPTIWDKALIYGSSVVAWLSGEAGRAAAAGAIGGLHRWLMSEKRRLIDGLFAAVSGAVCAQYLGPVVLAMLKLAGLRLGDGQDVDMTAGFIAGLMGMSLAKFLVAIVENKAIKLSGGDNDKQ